MQHPPYFSSLSNSNKTVSSAYLLTFCKVNLAWLWPGYLNGFVCFCLICFTCFYVYTTILSTMQNVRRLHVLCCSINLTWLDHQLEFNVRSQTLPNQTRRLRSIRPSHRQPPTKQLHPKFRIGFWGLDPQLHLRGPKLQTPNSKYCVFGETTKIGLVG